MSVLLGISGVKRNACAAACIDGRIVAACEEERVSRQRGVGLGVIAALPEAAAEVLTLAGVRSADVAAYVIAEDGVRLPHDRRTVTVDHHEAHAAAAFLSSPFERAAVLVCDSHADRELSVWTGEGVRLTDMQWRWNGRAFASLYAECASLFDTSGAPSGHRLEMLAHLGRGERVEQLRDIFQFVGDGLVVKDGWKAHIEALLASDPSPRHRAEIASAVQRRIGELLIQLATDIRSTLNVDALCLGGGLFYNTYFNTLIQSSGLFARTFVPINPGNAGLAIGATLLVSAGETGARRGCVSPFLGPQYDLESIKAILDGCKLSYEFVNPSKAVDVAVSALCRGQLVGWFQGRMEWGPRALGHRTILADPRSPYVLDNLNFFLRKRERTRPFGVAARADSVSEHFCGPADSKFMEYQYRPRDDRFRHTLPPGASCMRVQTVSSDAGPFRQLLDAMGEATGTDVLVNTSFNGFHEPIVCSPSDAVRVFYGTGLDMLVLEQFILKK